MLRQIEREEEGKKKKRRNSSDLEKSHPVFQCGRSRNSQTRELYLIWTERRREEQGREGGSYGARN